MRCARPSTMAVLPTPGSPISTGLFLVRRLSTCITRRISSSRPITGSSLPLPGLFGQIDGIALQRLIFRFGILVGHALRAAHRDQRLQNGVVVGAHACSAGCRPDRTSDRQSPSSRCSVETNSSLKCSASLKAASRTWFSGGRNVHAGRLAGDLRDGGQLAFRFGDQRSGCTPHFSSTGRTMPSRSRLSAISRCSGCTA